MEVGIEYLVQRVIITWRPHACGCTSTTDHPLVLNIQYLILATGLSISIAMPPSRKQPRPKKSSTKAPSLPFPKPPSSLAPAIPPTRLHAPFYHYPLLLDDEETAKSLLGWFEATESERSMPWRKDWVDPKKIKEDDVADVLAKRAYEVWVSEIMLQQTRVSTVIPYFNTWISKWPTVQDLAKADHDDVLSAWKGLGYYSRATRLHEGAKQIVSQSKSACPIPSTAEALQQIPGIGRYTAGAVSSIVFGVPEPVLDGNVVRVLSRQLGVYADGKDKKITDRFWEVADQLVKRVSGFPEVETSKVPGQWNQALMELGSTICIPRPKCEECPIQRTCRAYSEGVILNEQKLGHNNDKPKYDDNVLDIEDLCTLCEELYTEDIATATQPSDEGLDSATKSTDRTHQQSPPKKRRKVEPKKQSNTISNYFAVRTRRTAATAATTALPLLQEDEETIQHKSSPSPSPIPSTQRNKSSQNQIQTYAALFPKKVPKKKPAEQDAIICLLELASPGAITNKNDSKFFIEKRPDKGLLASLWQFPQCTLSSAEAESPVLRRAAATKFVAGLLSKSSISTTTCTEIGNENKKMAAGGEMQADYIADMGSLLHVFSHLRLTMHVLHFRISMRSHIKEEQPNSISGRREKGNDSGSVEEGEAQTQTQSQQRTKWTPACKMEDETLSTGMRRCWELFSFTE
ncbi:unnamed protein product [Periconia digitata]|uniref:Adenine DNA glycosylase n=1 Tax=Periconia digitata TaxID=1303443 RepID=A0A9W4UG30_9PLEO|nr:unnamed protein product [Periconia digitata]